jgi:hypothetical protein
MAYAPCPPFILIRFKYFAKLLLLGRSIHLVEVGRAVSVRAVTSYCAACSANGFLDEFHLAEGVVEAEREKVSSAFRKYIPYYLQKILSSPISAIFFET